MKGRPQPCSLLVLEDNNDDILLLKEFLAEIDSANDFCSTHLEPVFVSTLKEGIDYLARHQVDGIILDLSLGDSRGLDTLKSLRDNGAAEIPIIIMTVLDDKETGVEAVKMGAQEYLIKGEISPGLLFKSIRYAMERHLLKMQLEEETRALERSETQLMNIISNDPDGVVIVDRHSSIQLVNPAAEILLEKPEDALIGKPFGFPLDAPESVCTEIEIHRDSNSSVTAEMRAVKLDWDGDKATLISLRNISEKKKLLKALSEEKERLDVTLRSIADGVLVADENTYLQHLNWVACDMLGAQQDELIGQPLAQVLKLEDKSSGEVLATTRSQISKMCTPDICNRIKDSQWVIESLDRRKIPVEFSCAQIQKDDEFSGTVWVIRDVTEKKEMEEEAVRAQNLEALGVLAGGIAHEYNNILTSTLGYISLLKSVAGDDKKTQNRLKKVEKAGKRAKEIAARLLTFSRGGEPRKQLASFGKVLKSALKEIPKHSSIDVQIDVDDNCWPVQFDPEQVGQALKNIIKNSVEAMPEGGTISVKVLNFKVPAISLSNRRRGNYIKIIITDQGTGIALENRSKIFSPYFTTHSDAEGMGLTTAYSIIRKHGGWIRLKSPITGTKGSEVSILLPAQVTTEKEKPTPKLSPTIKQDKHGRGFVLVMDDELFIREVAQELLNSLDYEAVLVENGEDAVDCYREAMKKGNPFYAVILDLVIPAGMGGKECIQKLLELDPNVRGIVSSGYSNDPVMASHRDYGFIGVLPKPYQIQELSAVLDEVVKK
jgi:PAS domain S-box-containing protein